MTNEEKRVMMTRAMRSIGGVSVPDTSLIAEAIDYAQRLSEPYLFNHSMRSWLFAVTIAQAKALECDDEVVALGAILHDIGLTDGVHGDNRFEVNGANAARSFIRERGLSDRRAQLVWDLVALNSTASIALHKEPEVALGTMGIGLDYGGFGFEKMVKDLRTNVETSQAELVLDGDLDQFIEAEIRQL